MPCTVLVGLVFGARKVRSEKYPPLQQVGLQLAEVLCGLGLAVGGGSPADDIDQRETARVAGKNNNQKIRDNGRPSPHKAVRGKGRNR